MQIPIPEAGRDGKRLNINDLTFRREVRAIHRLGERVLAELLAEIDADPIDIAGKIARYAALDAGALRATGGDRLPPVIFAVPGDDDGRPAA